MQVIPAIDLRGGRVVRLRQGDFERQRSYGDDPMRALATGWRRGAERLHLVDLDGASVGQPTHLAWLAPIIDAAAVPARSAAVCAMSRRPGDAHAGADRVVLGTVCSAASRPCGRSSTRSVPTWSWRRSTSGTGWAWARRGDPTGLGRGVRRVLAEPAGGGGASLRDHGDRPRWHARRSGPRRCWPTRAPRLADAYLIAAGGVAASPTSRRSPTWAPRSDRGPRPLRGPSRSRRSRPGGGSRLTMAAGAIRATLRTCARPPSVGVHGVP